MTLEIKWQRLVSDGETCERCESTEEEIEKAVDRLKHTLEPLGTEVILKKETLSEGEFEKEPLKSNKISIDGRPIEDWLNAETGESECCDVCGDNDCRTVNVGGMKYETIPADLIINAGLKAASHVSKGEECCTGPEKDTSCCG